MWQLVTAAPNIETAYQQLLEEYEVAPELLRDNLTDLLARLVENGLLQVASSDVGTAPAI
jgi:hypothetical protein